MSAQAMTIDYDVTPAEIRAANRVLVPPGQPGLASQQASQKPRKRVAGSGVAGWALFIFLAVMMFMLLSSNQTRSAASPRAARPWTAASVCEPLAVLMIIGGQVWLSRSVRAAKRVRRGHETYSFSEDGVTRLMPGEWQRWPWQALHSFAETEGVFVLRTSREQGLVFPKRLFADAAQSDAFRALASRRLATPVQPASLDYEAV